MSTTVERPRIVTTMSERWRRGLAERLLKLTAMVGGGGTMHGAPGDSTVHDPYGCVVVLIDADSAIVASWGVRKRADQRRVQRALDDAYGEQKRPPRPTRPVAGLFALPTTQEEGRSHD